YTGEPNYETFQKWVLEAKDWLRLSYIRRQNRVARLKKYLSGRAFTFYMRDVARKPQDWTLTKFLDSLFNHCFPTNFREIQRTRYRAYKQNGHPIRDYQRGLERLAQSVGRIRHRDFILQFWEGADRRMRAHWAREGLSGERSSLTKLVSYAERYE
ncbi:hypothetical protein OBBRIDRAFT_702601, partial [Obba rivulosa]